MTDKHTKIGILGNLSKPLFKDTLPTVIEELKRRKVEFILDSDVANELGMLSYQTCPVEQIPDKVDLIFSFGGDGTFLRTARIIGDRGIPILGINVGPGLGYLTELHVEELSACLDRILSGDYEVEERMRMVASRLPDETG